MKNTGIQPVKWVGNQLLLLDQRGLPDKVAYLSYTTCADVAKAITDMVVRGAPAIGITAAYAVVLAAGEAIEGASSSRDWQQVIQPLVEKLSKARPTAVNLHWAIARMQKCISGLVSTENKEVIEALLCEAMAIHQEDIQANITMGDLASDLLPENCSVLTHCNAGALATGGYGTALGVIRSGVAKGKITSVYADETRPWLQGARLTAWELLQDNIPVTLIADSAAAYLMQQDKIQWIVVGSDRIAANGDVANKIGTYALAVAAKYHGIKFMVVAPTSTIDMNMPSGEGIPIETRSTDEVLALMGQRIAAEGANSWNPVFDITPASLVDAIVTEKGVVERPTAAKILAMMQHK
ncbi:S-methyl-5-thioribose-1-phosphate isomerase [Beggiatoa alba]|nr:S-methyl-5-thioribose-1-phosphate isomerase [Beggiatoa alba]